MRASGAFHPRCLKNNRVIKSAASADSLITKMHGSPRTLSFRCRAVVRGLPCILVIGEAALAADLITQLIFKHLERNLAVSEADASFEEVSGPFSSKYYWVSANPMDLCIMMPHAPSGF